MDDVNEIVSKYLSDEPGYRHTDVISQQIMNYLLGNLSQQGNNLIIYVDKNGLKNNAYLTVNDVFVGRATLTEDATRRITDSHSLPSRNLPSPIFTDFFVFNTDGTAKTINGNFSFEFILQHIVGLNQQGLNERLRKDITIVMTSSSAHVSIPTNENVSNVPSGNALFDAADAANGESSNSNNGITMSKIYPTRLADFLEGPLLTTMTEAVAYVYKDVAQLGNDSVMDEIIKMFIADGYPDTTVITKADLVQLYKDIYNRRARIIEEAVKMLSGIPSGSTLPSTGVTVQTWDDVKTDPVKARSFVKSVMQSLVDSKQITPNGTYGRWLSDFEWRQKCCFEVIYDIREKATLDKMDEDNIYRYALELLGTEIQVQ